MGLRFREKRVAALARAIAPRPRWGGRREPGRWRAGRGRHSPARGLRLGAHDRPHEVGQHRENERQCGQANERFHEVAHAASCHACHGSGPSGESAARGKIVVVGCAGSTCGSGLSPRKPTPRREQAGALDSGLTGTADGSATLPRSHHVTASTHPESGRRSSCAGPAGGRLHWLAHGVGSEPHRAGRAATSDAAAGRAAFGRTGWKTCAIPSFAATRSSVGQAGTRCGSPPRTSRRLLGAVSAWAAPWRGSALAWARCSGWR